MDIQFINHEEWDIEAKTFDVLIRRLKKHVPEIAGELNVVFVDDAYIRSLNKQYRQKDKPTDVLSFSYLDSSDFDKTGLMGEIYISIPTAREQAKQNKEPLQRELDKLFVHGFLHIFGYDHIKDEDYRKMHKVECEVLGRELPFISSEWHLSFRVRRGGSKDE